MQELRLHKSLVFAIFICVAVCAPAQTGKNSGEWLSYGLSPGETRYSPLTTINTDNVKRLGTAF